MASSLVKRPDLTQVLYNKSEEVCGSCVAFNSELNTCILVRDGNKDANVSPTGHCVLWQSKKKAIESLQETTPSNIDKEQIKTGTDHELEHTNDPKIAREIALDHLKEDKNYYTKLEKLEESEKSFVFKYFSPLATTQTENIIWKLSKKDGKVKRNIKIQGLSIGIETDKGEYREWYDPYTRTKGRTKMNYPYGFIRKTDGADGDSVDVFVGPNEDSDKVFVVHQMRSPSFRKYDEDKVMIGFTSVREAKAAYLEHFNDKRFLGELTTTTIDAFKRMFLESGPKTRQVNKAFMPGMMPGVMPGMMPGVMPGMMGMGPPPIDVETFEGVRALLSRIGDSKDSELMEVASEIWGPKVTYQNLTPEQAREEIIGFLLDQRDLLGVAPPDLSDIQEGMDTQQPLESNNTSQLSDQVQSPTGNLNNTDLVTQPSDNSLNSDFLSNQTKQGFSSIA